MALKKELRKQGNFLFTYRSYLPLIFLFTGLAVVIFHNLNRPTIVDPVSIKLLKSSAIFVGLVGLFIRILTVGYTPRNTSGRNTKEGQVAETLNTTGLYSLIRNPLYLGNYLMWLSIAMLTGNIWFIVVFSLVFWIYYERIVYAEEHFLRNKFGKEYKKWASHTPPILPKHFRYAKPAMPFSWKKVLKKEKNGLFALFTTFLVFDLVEEYARTHEIYFTLNWLSIATISSGILYFILKYLKHKTNLLNEENR